MKIRLNPLLNFLFMILIHFSEPWTLRLFSNLNTNFKWIIIWGISNYNLLSKVKFVVFIVKGNLRLTNMFYQNKFFGDWWFESCTISLMGAMFSPPNLHKTFLGPFKAFINNVNLIDSVITYGKKRQTNYIFSIYYRFAMLVLLWLIWTKLLIKLI